MAKQDGTQTQTDQSTVASNTENQQDVASAAAAGTSQDASAKKERSDALAEAGRIRKEHDRLKAELEAAQAKIAEYDAKDKEMTKKQQLQSIASEHGVDAATLEALAKHTTGTPEAIQEIAKALPKVSVSVVPDLRPDSNRTRGGSPVNKYQIMANFVSGKIGNEEYAKQLAAIGEKP